MGSRKKIILGNRIIGDGCSVFIIAEAGVAHFGDFEVAKKQIDAAVEAGCDAVKFQKRDVDSIKDKYWKNRLSFKEFSESEMIELKKYCDNKKISFFVTAHDKKSLDFVNNVLDVPFLKIGSGESLDDEFVAKVGACKKPVFVSFGLHLNIEEIKKTIKILEKNGATDIIPMYCSTVYPTPPNIIDMNQINIMRDEFNYPVGYSDHVQGSHFILTSIAKGVNVVEKHISLDKNDLRSLDCVVSCEPPELKLMVSQIRDIDVSKNKYDHKKRIKEILEARKWVGKMINKNL